MGRDITPLRRAVCVRQERDVHPGIPCVIDARSIQGSRGMNGRTTSSAADNTPQINPGADPMRSKVAASTSVGELPAPAPRAHGAPSICLAAASDHLSSEPDSLGQVGIVHVTSTSDGVKWIEAA